MLLKERFKISFHALGISPHSLDMLHPGQLIFVEKVFKLYVFELQAGKVGCLFLYEEARLRLFVICVVSEHLTDVG